MMPNSMTEPAAVVIKGYSGIQDSNYPIVTENHAVHHCSIQLLMMGSRFIHIHGAILRISTKGQIIVITHQNKCFKRQLQ